MNSIKSTEDDNFNMDDHMIDRFFTQEKADEMFKKINSMKIEERKLEKEFLSKVTSHIQILSSQCDIRNEIKEEDIENIKINKTGSLYSMFTNQYFDINLLIHYIEKYDEYGYLDTLINIMHQRFINDSIFFLPQLCTLFNYKNCSDSLGDYLLDRCVDQIKFSLKIHWLLCSYLDSSEKNSKHFKKYDKFIQDIEETLVNGKRCTLSTYLKYNDQMKSNKKNTQTQLFKQAINKELRLQYFDITVDFYQKLKEMCEKLREFPKESNKANNRNNIMRNYAYVFNFNIENTRAEHFKKEKLSLSSNNSTSFLKENFSIIKAMFNGIILPFDDSISTLDEHQSIIVRFIPEHSFCFSTKMRVPVKLCVECLRADECLKWESLYVREGGPSIPQNSQENLQSFTDVIKSITAQSIDLQNGEEHKELISSKSKKYEKLSDFLSEIQKESSTSNNLEEFRPVPLRSKRSETFEYLEFNEDTINPFGKKWSEIYKEIKDSSPFRKFETYTIKNFIAKANDDLRQELLAMQCIKRFQEIFKQADIPLRIRPYEILITSSSSGLIEFLANTNSIDGIKKKLPEGWNLNTFYRTFFKNNFEDAQKNFAESLAAYSLICYYLQIKDRHNGNILIDMKGSIIHIDFGFILGINPGNLNFESAPFKLTNEYVEILDGYESPIFDYYKSLMIRGMIEMRKHVDSFEKIIEIMSKGI
jgi:predicted DNA-binding antitoxin AbrB/MazE fold protein